MQGRHHCYVGCCRVLYMHKHQHPIKWEETTIVDQASRHQELLLKEAIHIYSAPRRNGSTVIWEWNFQCAGLQL